MMLAALSAIPREVEEAADVDGCTPLSKTFRAIVHLVRPTTLVTAIVLTISPKSTATAKYDEVTDAFSSGRVGMIIEGAPFSHLRASWDLGIPRGSKHPDATREFIKYSTSPEAQLVYTTVGAERPLLLLGDGQGDRLVREIHEHGRDHGAFASDLPAAGRAHVGGAAADPVPSQRDGLPAAGRIISSDHIVIGSIRNQAICLMTGHAAGTAAALCARPRGYAPPASRRRPTRRGWIVSFLLSMSRNLLIRACLVPAAPAVCSRYRTA